MDTSMKGRRTIVRAGGLAAGLAGLLLVASCSSGASEAATTTAPATAATTTSTTSTTAPADAARPTALCRKGEPGPRAVDRTGSLYSDAHGWSYRQSVPDAYDGARALPLLVVLGEPAPTPAVAEAVGPDAIVVQVPRPAAGQTWADDDAQEPFVRDLIEWLKQDLCFDAARVYLAGGGDASAAAAALQERLAGTVLEPAA